MRSFLLEMVVVNVVGQRRIDGGDEGRDVAGDGSNNEFGEQFLSRIQISSASDVFLPDLNRLLPSVDIRAGQ